MYLRKFGFKGIKGVCNKLMVDISPKEKEKVFLNNIEFFGLSKFKYDFAAFENKLFL